MRQQPPPPVLSREQRVAAEYAAMPPDTKCELFLNGVWKTMLAREVVAHHLKLHEAKHG
jgi:hypothetical protein